jgi:hypothetical protein
VVEAGGLEGRACEQAVPTRRRHGAEGTRRWARLALVSCSLQVPKAMEGRGPWGALIISGVDGRAAKAYCGSWRGRDEMGMGTRGAWGLGRAAAAATLYSDRVRRSVCRCLGLPWARCSIGERAAQAATAGRVGRAEHETAVCQAGTAGCRRCGLPMHRVHAA